MPLIGPRRSDLVDLAKYAHHFVSWAFMLGVVLMLLTWIRHNLPDRYDAKWLKSDRRILRPSNPNAYTAGRFQHRARNFIFWSVVVGGAALSVSGVFMLFPFSFTDVNGMQMAQYVHAHRGPRHDRGDHWHIYIGHARYGRCLQAMGSGSVDLNWAKEHHSSLGGEQQGKTGCPDTPHTAAEPAE